jgi:hypothetical protein
MIPLPVELYGSIAEQCTWRVLFRLLVVSRTFRSDAERLIYRKIAVSTPDGINSTCGLILRTPRSWPLIRNLTIWMQDIDFHQWESGQPRTLLPSVFEKLNNLETLKFIDYQRARNRLLYCADLFQNSSFQLRTLSCLFPLDANFASFLETQQRLMFLEWRPQTAPVCTLRSEAVPNIVALRLLGGFGSETIQAMGPGRPISHFAGGVGVGIPLLDTFRHSTISLTSLSLARYAEMTLLELPDLFPQLQCLLNVDYAAINVGRFSRLTFIILLTRNLSFQGKFVSRTSGFSLQIFTYSRTPSSKQKRNGYGKYRLEAPRFVPLSTQDPNSPPTWLAPEHAWPNRT